MAIRHAILGDWLGERFAVKVDASLVAIQLRRLNVITLRPLNWPYKLATETAKVCTKASDRNQLTTSFSTPPPQQKCLSKTTSPKRPRNTE
ncbi:hypothetical protein SAMN06265222_11579 [Neorhodopirellula lusitana]|uniref:Uncharacterized protein n=1 Tax=Neorhodopirellula lusitana TaxID=445327 RepID=A0ABY1QL61_9BACT|nr:hypothetical protein SAMN06265222_11579 [Neorhodopirellula lusitana]